MQKQLIMPRCACASEVYGSVCLDCYSLSVAREPQQHGVGSKITVL